MLFQAFLALFVYENKVGIRILPSYHATVFLVAGNENV